MRRWLALSLASSVGATLTLDCSRCTLQAGVFGYTHAWCAVDQRCYGLGSRWNPCGPTECASHSALSRCAARCPPTRPSQLRLALAGQDSQGWPTGVSITWFTYESGARSVVELWDQHHQTQWVARSSEYCPPFGQHHTATLSGLEDGRVYQYRVGGDSAAWSEWQTLRFRTGANGRPYRLHVFGDLGYANSTARPMQTTASRADLVGNAYVRSDASVGRRRLGRRDLASGRRRLRGHQLCASARLLYLRRHLVRGSVRRRVLD